MNIFLARVFLYSFFILQWFKVFYCHCTSHKSCFFSEKTTFLQVIKKIYPYTYAVCWPHLFSFSHVNWGKRFHLVGFNLFIKTWILLLLSLWEVWWYSFPNNEMVNLSKEQIFLLNLEVHMLQPSCTHVPGISYAADSKTPDLLLFFMFSGIFLKIRTKIVSLSSCLW